MKHTRIITAVISICLMITSIYGQAIVNNGFNEVRSEWEKASKDINSSFEKAEKAVNEQTSQMFKSLRANVLRSFSSACAKVGELFKFAIYEIIKWNVKYRVLSDWYRESIVNRNEWKEYSQELLTISEDLMRNLATWEAYQKLVAEVFAIYESQKVLLNTTIVNAASSADKILVKIKGLTNDIQSLAVTLKPVETPVKIPDSPTAVDVEIPNRPNLYKPQPPARFYGNTVTIPIRYIGKDEEKASWFDFGLSNTYFKISNTDKSDSIKSD